MKRRTFNIHHPVNQDVAILILREYEWDEGKENEAVQRVLTEDGWFEHEPWEQVNLASLPQISGLDMHVTKRSQAEMDAFAQRVRDIMADDREALRLELADE